MKHSVCLRSSGIQQNGYYRLSAASIPVRSSAWTRYAARSGPLIATGPLGVRSDSFRARASLADQVPGPTGSATASTSSSPSPVEQAPAAGAQQAHPSGKKARGGGGGRGGGRGFNKGGRGGSKSRTDEASAAARAAADALFADPGPSPLRTPQIGPVRVQELGGDQGRGLMTTRAVQPGELLLAVRPLALAWDQQQQQQQQNSGQAEAGSLELADLKFLSLQRQLLGRSYTSREAAWLDSLTGLPPLEEEEDEEVSASGSREGQEDAGTARPPAPDLQSSEAAQQQGGSAEEQPKVPLSERLRDPDTLADVVQANCLEPDGGAEDEEAYWARREAAAAATAATAAVVAPTPAGGAAPRRRGPVGLWPEAALLNHSCLPNTVAYLVGDTLFVRAARKLRADTQLTVSYLPVGAGGPDAAADLDDANEQDGADAGASAEGEPAQTAAAAAPAAAASRGSAAAGEPELRATLLSPLEERRGALEESRGFVCGCSRCLAEEALDPRLRTLMAEVVESVGALREDLAVALSMAVAEREREDDGAEEEGDEDEEGEEEAPATQPAAASAGREALRRGGSGPEQGAAGEDEAAEEDEEDEGEESRWREMAGSVADQAGMYIELVDAAMTKLKLAPDEQMAVQAVMAPLYALLWEAMAARGDMEPRLADVVAALVGQVAPGSADHLWWAATARDMAEIMAAEEEEEAEDGNAAAPGGGGGGFGSAPARPPNGRVASADQTLYRAYTTRYGPISRRVYGKLLEARRRRQDQQDPWEGGVAA